MKIIFLILCGMLYGGIGSTLEQYGAIIQPVWWAMYGFIWGLVSLTGYNVFKETS